MSRPVTTFGPVSDTAPPPIDPPAPPTAFVPVTPAEPVPAQVEQIAAGYAFDAPALEFGAAVVDGTAYPQAKVRIPLSVMNRHGLVAGATGTGKTKTLQLMAEQLVGQGVPVFLADVKGDLSGLASAGTPSEKLLKRIAEQGQTNIRIVQHDAVEVLEHMIAPGSLAGVHIFFPDPWHKKKHNKRRLIQPALVARLASRLAPGGYLHCATDWQPYAEQMLQVLSAEPLLTNTVPDYAPQPAYRPLTKFENRGLKLGHGVWDLIFLRRA